MVSSSGLVLRSFKAPADYNINHLLQPAAAFLGRRIHEAVELRTVTNCEVVQYLFKVTDGRQNDHQNMDMEAVPVGYIDYLRSISLLLYRTVKSPFHAYVWPVESTLVACRRRQVVLTSRRCCLTMRLLNCLS